MTGTNTPGPGTADPGAAEVRPGTVEVRTVDYHTAGEPFRIVTDGVPVPPGDTVAERREYARTSAEHERIRTLLAYEPRGHAGMYGCLLVPPDDEHADLGALFWHTDGWSTACGHGTIALGRWAADSGLVELGPDGTAEVTVDVPSGRVRAHLASRDGHVGVVAFENVASYVLGHDVAVRTGFGEVGVDLAYSGAIYASVPASAFDLVVTPDRFSELVDVGHEVKAALDGTEWSEHPSDPRLSGVYGTILYDDLGETAEGLHQRNITVFADRQVDRSPCGSGTAARLALLHAAGRIGVQQRLIHDSVIGTRFHASVQQTTTVDGRPAVVGRIEGSAHRTGEHQFVLAGDDELGPGFVLR